MCFIIQYSPWIRKSHIYIAGQQAVSYAQGLSQAELAVNKMRISAILYQILIVGEATKRLSREFKSLHREIPWDDMAGMRDIVAHQYDRINFAQLWNVIQLSIPELLKMIESLLPEQSDESPTDLNV